MGLEELLGYGRRALPAMSTGLLSPRITAVVSSALTWLIVAANAGPSASIAELGHDRHDVAPSRTRSRVGEQLVVAARELAVGRLDVRPPGLDPSLSAEYWSRPGAA